MAPEHDPLPYFRGPLPRNVVPLRAPSTAAASTPAAVEAPTWPTSWHQLASGRWAVLNPNQCEICHRGRHRDLRHHAFEAAVETLPQAKLLGWPLPQEPHP